MGTITESALNAELKAGKLRRVYFLYGEEDFLVKTYADRVTALAVPEDARDMNFVKYSEPPKSDDLSDQVDNMPFFADYKCVMIDDLDAEDLDNAEHKAYLSVIANVPDTTVLIIALKCVVIDPKKIKAKTKKLMAACSDAGCVCEFKRLTPAKLACMTEKKFAKAGCSISSENAAYLAEECGGSLTVLQTEIEKLCSYRQSGEITREDIAALVPRRVDSNIYSLAKELFAGRTGNALHILDDLFVQRTEPFLILSALSGHFTDLYRAKLGQQAKKSSADTAKAFGYYGRTFVMDGAYRSVKNLSARYLGDCVAMLYKANRLMNSTRSDRRTLIERTIIEISALK